MEQIPTYRGETQIEENNFAQKNRVTNNGFKHCFKHCFKQPCDNNIQENENKDAVWQINS